MVEDPQVIEEIARELGSQSVIVALDIKKNRFGQSYEVWTNNGSQNSRKCPIEFGIRLEQLGVGEIIVNFISNDGVMQGYDIAILKKIGDSVSVPITALGGAGSFKNIRDLLQELGDIGAAAGSLFGFKGSYKAVPINYPSESIRESIHNV